MTRMSDQQERKRGEMEDQLFVLSNMERRMMLAELRVRQAVNRSGLHYLLNPVLDDIGMWRTDLKRANEYLGGLWREGNQQEWK